MVDQKKHFLTTSRQGGSEVGPDAFLGNVSEAGTVSSGLTSWNQSENVSSYQPNIPVETILKIISQAKTKRKQFLVMDKKLLV